MATPARPTAPTYLVEVDRACLTTGLGFVGGSTADFGWASTPDTCGAFFDVARGDLSHLVSTGDLSDAMDDVLRRTRMTYRLRLEPARIKRGGGFHPVSVSLAEPGPAIDAVAGFWVPEG